MTGSGGRRRFPHGPLRGRPAFRPHIQSWSREGSHLSETLWGLGSHPWDAHSGLSSSHFLLFHLSILYGSGVYLLVEKTFSGPNQLLIVVSFLLAFSHLPACGEAVFQVMHWGLCERMSSLLSFAFLLVVCTSVPLWDMFGFAQMSVSGDASIFSNKFQTSSLKVK